MHLVRPTLVLMAASWITAGAAGPVLAQPPLPRLPALPRPILTGIGMPLPAGALNLAASAAMAPGLTTTRFILDAGLTSKLGLEVTAPYVGLGTNGAYLSEFGADVQLGIVGRPAGNGISAILGLHVPGSAAGLSIGSMQPLVGLRGQAQVGPFLGLANVGWFPGLNQTEIRAAGLWQVLPVLAPGLELGLVGGPVQLASLTPEINVRPVPNLGVGLGYEIPIAGSATGQVVAQAQFLF